MSFEYKFNNDFLLGEKYFKCWEIVWGIEKLKFFYKGEF